MQERDSDQFARVELTVDAEPRVIISLTLIAIPRPTKFPIARLSEDEAMTGILDVLREAATADRFSGAVLVEQNGQLLFSRACGLADREREIPNTLQTQFRIGSINKMFTGTAVLPAGGRPASAHGPAGPGPRTPARRPPKNKPDTPHGPKRLVQGETAGCAFSTAGQRESPNLALRFRKTPKERTMKKLAGVLRAIARLANRAVAGMAEDRPGGGMAARREREENMPPDWARKDLGI